MKTNDTELEVRAQLLVSCFEALEGCKHDPRGVVWATCPNCGGDCDDVCPFCENEGVVWDLCACLEPYDQAILSELLAGREAEFQDLAEVLEGLERYRTPSVVHDQDVVDRRLASLRGWTERNQDMTVPNTAARFLLWLLRKGKVECLSQPRQGFVARGARKELGAFLESGEIETAVDEDTNAALIAFANRETYWELVPVYPIGSVAVPKILRARRLKDSQK